MLSTVLPPSFFGAYAYQSTKMKIGPRAKNSPPDGSTTDGRPANIRVKNG